ADLAGLSRSAADELELRAAGHGCRAGAGTCCSDRPHLGVNHRTRHARCRRPGSPSTGLAGRLMTTPRPTRPPWPRRRLMGLAAVLAAVVLVHACITHQVMTHLHDVQQGQTPQIERMQATLIADMQLTEPPVVSIPPAAPAPAPLVSE